FGQRHHFAQLAARADTRLRARLHCLPRIDAPAGDEPLRAILGARRGSMSRLARGGTVDQAQWRAGRTLEAPSSKIQTPENGQSPTSWFWKLSIRWSLELGSWSLELPHCRRGYRQSISSISNISVARGGILGGRPFSP